VEAVISTVLFAPSVVKLEGVAATLVPPVIPRSAEVPDPMEAPDRVEISRSVEVTGLVEASRLEETPGPVELSPVEAPNPDAEDSATSPNTANRVSTISFFFNIPILQFFHIMLKNVIAGQNGIAVTTG
jgi:hypothetical protein